MKQKPTKTLINSQPAADGRRDGFQTQLEREPAATKPRKTDEVQAGLDFEQRPVHFDTGSLDAVRRQLHDGLGQILTSACFLASTLQSKLRKRGVAEGAELDEMIGLLNQAIAESQSLVAHCDHTRRSLLAREDRTAAPE